MLEADQTTNRKLFRTMARGKKQTLKSQISLGGSQTARRLKNDRDKYGLSFRLTALKRSDLLNTRAPHRLYFPVRFSLHGQDLFSSLLP